MKNNRFVPLKNRFRCFKCNRLALWYYVPTDERDQLLHYFCDDCVPRGCDCRIDSDTQLEYVDAKGRLLPCIEFDFSQNGFSSLPFKDAKWKFLGVRADRRERRGYLRRWLKNPDLSQRPYIRRRIRNDLVASRLLEKIDQLLSARS